jgi:hypothetical protein
MMAQSKAKKRIITFLKKRHPELKDEELPLLLKDIRRFVTVIQKIYNEPQAKVSIKEVKENGQKVKKRIVNTNIQELAKLVKGTGRPITGETFRELTEKVLHIKSKRHGER